MLVLTRRCGESLIIGEQGEIRITFLENKGKQVRIGIEAPKHISIDREEIFIKKKRDLMHSLEIEKAVDEEKSGVVPSKSVLCFPHSCKPAVLCMRYTMNNKIGGNTHGDTRTSTN